MILNQEVKKWATDLHIFFAQGRDVFAELKFRRGICWKGLQ